MENAFIILLTIDNLVSNLTNMRPVVWLTSMPQYTGRNVANANWIML